jgi:AcrR family transcriptional regulator
MEFFMTRITKDPEERRNEILDTAQRLFIEKGYVQTSVSEIVKEIGVAQGTFYYYFKTKEDIINAIINRYTDEIVTEAESCVNMDCDTKQKLENIALAEMRIASKNNSYLHRIQSADIHTRILTVLVQKLTPFYTLIIKEGIQNGLWKTDYPQELAESMLVTTHILFDPGLFRRTKEEFERCVSAWLDSVEKTLGLESGWMDNLGKILVQIYKNV